MSLTVDHKKNSANLLQNFPKFKNAIDALKALFKQLQKCLGVFDFFNFQKTFYFNPNLWSNKNEFNLSVGKTGFDSQVTKPPTYWKTPFSKICLGMKIGQQAKCTVNVHAKQGRSQDFS